MGSLRTLNSAKRIDTIQLLGKRVAARDTIKMIYQDSGGYNYIWEQGEFTFTFKVYLDRDEAGDYTFTAIELLAETRVDAEPGDDCDYYTYRNFYKTHLPDNKRTYEYKSEIRDTWEIHRDGVFAIRRFYPDFPHGWIKRFDG
jgi:hypothetical protein